VGITPVGGIVLDLVGANGSRVVSQLPATSLFKGFFNHGTPSAYQGNPGTIGVQTGFTAATLDALGGGLSEAAVRLTVFDGDTAAGNFDHHHNELLLNGQDFGDFSDVPTEETNQGGTAALSTNPGGGFRNNTLDTGFFFSADRQLLDRLLTSMAATGEVRFQLRDVNPFDNFFDFTQGLDGGLVNVGQPPTVANPPPQTTNSNQAAGTADVGTASVHQAAGAADVGTAPVHVVSPAPATPAPARAPASINLVSRPPGGGGEHEANSSVTLPSLSSPGVALTGTLEPDGNLVRAALTAAMEAQGSSPPVLPGPPVNPDGTAGRVAELDRSRVTAVEVRPVFPVLFSSPLVGGGEPEVSNTLSQTPLDRLRAALTAGGEAARNLVRAALRAGMEAQGQVLQLLGPVRLGLGVAAPPIRPAVGPQDPPAVQLVANVVPRAAPPSPNTSPARTDPERAGGKRRGLGATRTTLLAMTFLVLYQHWQRSKMAASAILHRRWASRVPPRSPL
jgi:hypothetical protein